MLPSYEARKARRRKHVDFTERGVTTQLEQLLHQFSVDAADRVAIPLRYRTPCRSLTFHSSWVNAVAASPGYVPILKQSAQSEEYRMRSVGISGSSGPSICIFDLELGSLVFSINGHRSTVYSIAVSSPPKGMLVHPIIASGSHDGLMKLWELQTGRLLHEVGKRMHPGPVRAVCVYEGLNAMAVAGTEKEVWVWHLESGDLIGVMKGHNKHVTCVRCFRAHDSFADDLNPAVIISSDLEGVIMLWHMKDRELRNRIIAHQGPVYCIEAVRHDPALLISGGFDGLVKVWNIVTVECLYVLEKHEAPVFSLCILHTPVLGVVSGCAEGAVHVWALLPDVSPVKSFDLEDDEVDEDCDTERMRVHEIERTVEPLNRYLGSLIGHTGPVKSIASTLQPRPMIITGSHDNTAKIWDISLPEGAAAGVEEEVQIGLRHVLRWQGDEDVDGDSSDNEDDYYPEEPPTVTPTSP